jgi:hypothetical protein
LHSGLHKGGWRAGLKRLKVNECEVEAFVRRCEVREAKDT